MRHLSLLLLAPWLIILGWAYFTYPRNLPRTALRRLFDVAVLLAAIAAAGTSAAVGYDAVALPAVDEFGRRTGAIWQQVLPALCGYGAGAGVLAVGLLLRHLAWGRPKENHDG